jgi:glycosyltransferase 2 family protein
MHVKRIITHYILPWAITIGALFYVFEGIDWQDLADLVTQANPHLLVCAAGMTAFSYCLRARRWQTLFPDQSLRYWTSLRVLIFGFFMNNLLPARAGELVRAHTGAQQTGKSRALVLATVASERLADGLTLSILFVLFALNLGDSYYSRQLLYVALAFGLISTSVIAVLVFQNHCRAILKRFGERYKICGLPYLLIKSSAFLDGLSPLSAWPSWFYISLWSIVIWILELGVFIVVSMSYDVNLSVPLSVLFMVSVNFSSLIPAAPGGLGVIEAIATSVLVSGGIPKEQALAMVITQHAIQFFIVGIGGTISLIASRQISIRGKREQTVTATSESSA